MTAGSQAVFPGTARNLLLSLGGVIQEPDTNFTISGSTLTFTTAPVANTTFFAVIFGDMQSTGTPSDGTVLPASIASSGNFSFPQLTVTGTSSLGDDVTFTGANYNVVWDKSANALEFADNAKATFGTANDLQIFHNGSNSFIDSSTGNLYLRGDGGQILFRPNNSEDALVLKPNGAVELYYDNVKELETTANGIDINSTGSGNGLLRINGASGNTEGIIIQRDGTEASRISHSNSADLIFSMGSSVATKLKLTSGGNLQIPVDNAKLQIGAGQDLFLEHDGNNSVFRNTTGDLYIQDNSAGTIFIQPVNNEGSITAIANGRVELAFDGGKKFETTAGGAIVTGTLDTTDTISSGNSNIKTNGDTGKFLAGASNDLQIYHDGSHSRIIDSGTGVLSLQSDNLRIHNVSANEYMAEFV